MSDSILSPNKKFIFQQELIFFVGDYLPEGTNEIIPCIIGFPEESYRFCHLIDFPDENTNMGEFIDDIRWNSIPADRIKTEEDEKEILNNLNEQLSLIFNNDIKNLRIQRYIYTGVAHLK